MICQWKKTKDHWRIFLMGKKREQYLRSYLERCPKMLRHVFISFHIQIYFMVAKVPGLEFIVL